LQSERNSGNNQNIPGKLEISDSIKISKKAPKNLPHFPNEKVNRRMCPQSHKKKIPRKKNDEKFK
jgi:hypothetical protein